MQIAPKNLFRYHGDGAQWNAGLGEIVYKKLGWRTAALIGDDYSFPWTSAAGIIADFCGIGGKITKRVWTPPAGGDYAPFIRQLPRPNQVDGYFWLVGGANTSCGADRVRAGVRAAQREAALGQPVPVLPGRQHDGRAAARRCVHGWLRHVPDRWSEEGPGSQLREEREQVVHGSERERRVLLQLLERRVGDGPGPRQVERSGRSGAAACDAAHAQARLPGRQQRRPEARQPPPGDSGSVPAPDHQGSR